MILITFDDLDDSFCVFCDFRMSVGLFFFVGGFFEG